MAYTLTVPFYDVNKGIHTYASCFKRLNIEYTFNIDSDGVFPITDIGALSLAGHKYYMPKESLDILLNKSRLSEIGIPVLPTRELKPNETVDTTEHIKSNNSTTPNTQKIVQPNIGFPVRELDISVAVNSSGDIFTFLPQYRMHYASKRPGENLSADKKDVDEILPHIRKACSTLNIRGGIHTLGFVMYKGKWCLIDWNPRPAAGHTIGLAATSDYMDIPIAFMLGIPMSKPFNYHLVTKGYWGSPIAITYGARIRELGLVPRTGKGMDGFVQVSGISDSLDDLNHKFLLLEKLI